MPNEAIVTERLVNESTMETHEILGLLLGVLAARKADNRLVITGDEFARFQASVIDMEIKGGDEVGGNFVVTVQLPAEG